MAVLCGMPTMQYSARSARLIINYLIFTIIRLLYTKIYYRVNSNATSTLACWRHHANDFATLRLERYRWKSRRCPGMSFLVRSLEARGMTELIPTVQMESEHSIGAQTSRDFPRFETISKISRPEAGSRSR